MAVGDIWQRLVEGAWSVDFLGDKSQELLDGLPPWTEEYTGFLIAAEADLADAGEFAPAWLACWRTGYLLGLSRLHLENTECGRTPPHEWVIPPAESVIEPWKRLARLGVGTEEELRRRLGWLSYGALAPFSTEVMHGALAFIASRYEGLFWPRFPVGEPRLRLSGLLELVAASGYAVARCQQEGALVEQFLSRTS